MPQLRRKSIYPKCSRFPSHLYEDGSTAVRLQKNRGKFRSAFNLSIESGLLLSAYMDYMAEIGEKDFAANTMTDKDLDGIFQ